MFDLMQDKKKVSKLSQPFVSGLLSDSKALQTSLMTFEMTELQSLSIMISFQPPSPNVLH